jgi:hypothetical protein
MLVSLSSQTHTPTKPLHVAHGDMVTLGFALVMVSCIYGMYRLSTRIPSYRFGWPGVWRLACVIAGLRVAALWFGATGLRRPDWLQVPAYFVLMLDLPEIYLVSSARTEPFRWAMLGTMILAATSFAWAAAFFWLWNRLELKAETTLGRSKNR